MSEIRVGFLGLGTMGKGMAKNLLKSGFNTTVYDIREEPLEELRELGANIGASAKELAEASDVVMTMVRDDEQTQEVLYGDSGVLKGLDQGDIILNSTINPQLVQHIAKEVKKGICVLDSPVSGGAMGAEAGTLTLMVGGEKEVLEKNRTVLEAISERIVYCGPHGAGLIAKLTNSMLFEMIVSSMQDALSLGQKGNIDPETLLNIYKTSTAGSWVAENWDFITDFIKSNKPGGSLALMRKDVGLALDFAERNGIAIPLCKFAHFNYLPVIE